MQLTCSVQTLSFLVTAMTGRLLQVQLEPTRRCPAASQVCGGHEVVVNAYTIIVKWGTKAETAFLGRPLALASKHAVDTQALWSKG